MTIDIINRIGISDLKKELNFNQIKEAVRKIDPYLTILQCERICN